MDAHAARLAAGLEHGRADAEVLRRVGEPDPERAAGAFLRAAREPELASCVDVWLPALLHSARPGFGAQCLVELAGLHRERRGSSLDVAGAPAVPRLLGSSNFLARLLLRRPEAVDLLAGDPPDAPQASVAPEWSAIRRAKYDGLLQIAARDLLGRPFDESLRELSDLADRCLAAGLACSARESDCEPPSLFALGKLGGRELNFSSDVDLLFVFEPPPGADPQEHLEAVSALVRRLKRALEEPTQEGFAYRVDLDLRPEGPAGVIANSVDAALTYYETFGAEWERQMLIRLRAVAGPDGVCDAFASAVTPFVYRRLIDPGVLDSVRNMKARIESERRSAGRDLEANLKEGPGGIRDVEFLVQSLQLFFGARHESIRTGNVLDALVALGDAGLLPHETVASLTDAYTWLRRAEHALQLAEEQQTALFPREAGAQLALARRMGYGDAEAADARDRLLEDWTNVRAEVRRHFDALVLRRDA